MKTPLQEEILQLKEKLKPYKIDGIYTSPSLRTLETVEQVVDREIRSRLVYPVEALREIDFGLFEGKNFKWAKQHYPQEVQKMIEETQVDAVGGGKRTIPCHMINCFCGYSDYEPLTLDEWILNDRKRKKQR